MLNPTTTTISTISDKPTLYNLYMAELEAAQKEQRHRSQPDAQPHQEDQAVQEGPREPTLQPTPSGLQREIDALSLRVTQYNNAERIKNDKRRKAENAVSNVLNPTLGLAWNVLLSIGIIVQETVAVATPILGVFLFPLNFALEGVRNIWGLYQTARNDAAAHRKTVLGTTVVHILGLIAASVVVALAVTNPFALPAIFLGLTGAGMYKSAYALHQTRKSIEASENELSQTITAINTLKDVDNPDRKDILKLERLEAKENRLNEQLTQLKAERFELRRQIVFNTLGMAAVGLLLASAVLTIVFPPAAAALAGAGMLMFASTVIASVLTSPPVVAKLKQFGRWVAGLFGAEAEVAPPREAVANRVDRAVPNDDVYADEDDSLLVVDTAQTIAATPETVSNAAANDAELLAETSHITRARTVSNSSVVSSHSMFQPEPATLDTTAEQSTQRLDVEPEGAAGRTTPTKHS